MLENGQNGHVAMAGKWVEMMVLLVFFQEIDDKVVDWLKRVIISEVKR